MVRELVDMRTFVFVGCSSILDFFAIACKAAEVPVKNPGSDLTTCGVVVPKPRPGPAPGVIVVVLTSAIGIFVVIEGIG